MHGSQWPRVAAARAAGLDYFSLAAVDWHGRLRAKQLRLGELEHAFAYGVPMTSALYAVDSAERPMDNSRFQDPANGYRDGLLRADAAYGEAFGARDGGLVVLGSMVDRHAVYCPRAVLHREVTALAALGFTAWGGFEYEFHVLAETPDTLRAKTPAQLARLPEFERMYSYVDQSLKAPLFEGLRTAADQAGISIESLHAEFNGLLEAALAPTAGMAIADHAVLFKALAKILARQHGLMAVFMAQLADGFESAGAHLNLSLRDSRSGRAVASEATAPEGISPVFRQFLGGLQRYTPGLALMHLPYLNSCKRLTAPSFAPRTNSWGVDNKTCAWRVINATPALARVECRLPGADVHPHLALAAALAAGRRGIAERLEPTPPVQGDAAASPHVGTPFPLRFDAAIEAWRQSALAHDVFGEAFVAAYAESREWQLDLLRRTVTDFDLRQFAESA